MVFSCPSILMPINAGAQHDVYIEAAKRTVCEW